MSDVITNMKVRFGADTKQFKKGMNDGTRAVQTFKNDAGSAMEQFANQFGVSLGPLGGILNKATTATKGLSAGFKGAAASTGLMTKAMKFLKVALISTGIGALVVLIGSLITAFSRFQDQNDKLTVKLAGLKAVVNVVLDRIGKLGEAVLSLLKGDFKDAAQSVREAFQGLGDEIQREFEIGQKLKELIIDLERRGRLFEAEKEAAFSEIQNLRALSKDKLADDQARLNAIKEAGKIEERIAEKSLQLAEEELAAALDSYSVEEDKLKLTAEGADLIERIRKGQIGSAEAQELAKDLTLDDANARDTLYGIIDKIVAREKEQQRIIQTRLRIQNAENTVRQEILNKEIAGLKSVANLRKQQAEEDKITIDERNRLIREAASLELQALKVALDGNKINQTQYAADVLKIRQDLKKELDSQNLNTLDTIGLSEGTSEKIQLETEKLTANLKTGLEGAKNVILDFADVFNSTFESLAVSFGESIGNIISGAGGFQDFGKIVLSSLGDLAIKVGKMAIGTGIAIKGIKTALKSLNPVVAIAGGVALVAIGTAIKGALANAASGGTSGNISSNSGVFDARTGDLGTTATAVQAQPVKINLTGQFVQRGTDLVSVIDETNTRISYNG